jgi:hypothetical protein
MAFAGIVAVAFAGAFPAHAQSNATPPAATPPATAPAEKPEKPKRHLFTGLIESINTKANTVVVKHKEDTKTFSISDATKYSTEDKKDAALADFQVGEKVTVHYTEEAGVLVAHKITTPKKTKSD